MGRGNDRLDDGIREEDPYKRGDIGRGNTMMDDIEKEKSLFVVTL